MRGGAKAIVMPSRSAAARTCGISDGARISVNTSVSQPHDAACWNHGCAATASGVSAPTASMFGTDSRNTRALGSERIASSANSRRDGWPTTAIRRGRASITASRTRCATARAVPTSMMLKTSAKIATSREVETSGKSENTTSTGAEASDSAATAW